MNSLFTVKDKTILVTGGSRGIGYMIATCYVKAGARVYISSRDEERCAAVEKELSALGFCRAISGDLSKLSEIERIISELEALEPKLDVLVNNAGATWGASLEDFPEKGWDKVASLNVKTPFFLIQRALPMLKVGAISTAPSRVINIGSVDGIKVPIWDNYSYAASKAGLHHLSKTLVRPLAEYNININTIAPGPFSTDMMAPMQEAGWGDTVASEVPLKRFGEAGDIIGTALFLASPASSYVTGAIIPVDGGMSGAA
jgi:NAD(P)-dependent dehydrogenase (short-subunit alcohol dehydrogenase family)